MDNVELNQRLSNLHYNILSNMESDKISDEETEVLVSLDQSILEYLGNQDLR